MDRTILQAPALLPACRQAFATLHGFVARAGAAPIGREIQVTKRHQARRGKALCVLREPAPQLVVCRLAQRRCVLHDELHLLRQAAFYDGVVLVEAQRHRLAEENLLADLAVEEIAHLLRRGRALPLRHPGEPDLREVISRNRNAVGILALTGTGIERVVDDEQR